MSREMHPFSPLPPPPPPFKASQHVEMMISFAKEDRWRGAMYLALFPFPFLPQCRS